MLMMDVLEKNATEIGDKVAIVFQNEEITYAQFYNEAQRVAAYLQQQQLGKGDIVALLMENTAKFPIAYFAVQMAGYIVMPINTKLAPPEVEFIFKNSQAKGVIVDSTLTNTLEAIDYHNHFTILTEELFFLERFDYAKPLVDDADIAVVMYTSGTTGKPKGVMLTHRNIYITADIWAEPMQLTADDRLFICTPLFHCAGAHVFMVPAFRYGATFIIEAGFSPKNIVRQLSETKATFFFGVSAMYTLILNDDHRLAYDLSSLRLFGYGAAPMPFELIKRLKEAYPAIKVQNFYGQTENSPAASSLTDEDALTKIGSVGKPLRDTEIRIDDGNGQSLPQGYVGEIVVKGPQVMKGYLNNDIETEMALRDGWLYSGDLGRLDEEGYLYIVDRKKDMIIRSGENIYPIEVEEVLYQIPTILEAAVVGIPHAIYGEVPKAYIRLKDGHMATEQQILDYCATQLAKYKLPFEMEFIDELPRNASGKVLKHVLRA
ncbi:class I adenylate-forming enzyme family protein [Kurthia sibirica]|uniref:AMP-dependent synthetase n=1 Tax=Kurthia sibirica TaxID=202750 RepID=A0A2U3ALE3_9BACL|nr:long-chain-fatty-acid--CoA ligase [Kurthia sibirica]PWI25334.1 AMP-dependent synthetase [Kurthia sibirica]GEK34420.1 long-chain-fatty-acid--CoA ligase [Kurthia sibirica]